MADTNNKITKILHNLYSDDRSTRAQAASWFQAASAPDCVNAIPGIIEAVNDQELDRGTRTTLVRTLTFMVPTILTSGRSTEAKSSAVDATIRLFQDISTTETGEVQEYAEMGLRKAADANRGKPLTRKLENL